MVDLQGKSVSLIGFGVSSEAMCRYLNAKNIRYTVRCEKECALPKGARAVFGKEYLNTDEDIVFRSPGVHPEKIKGHGLVLTEAAYALSLLPCFKLGVTGSDGKTTTSTLIYQMLLAGGKNAFLCGNIGYPIIDLVNKASSDGYLVAELSSFQLMDGEICLDIAAVTNISENHLDYHKDMGEYISAKENIVKNASLAVLNYDDEIVRRFSNKRTLYFSLKDRRGLVNEGLCFVHIVNGYVWFNNTPLFPVSEIRLRGDFNVQNVLCAVGCAYGIVGKDGCYKVSKEFCGVMGRQEAVRVVNGVTYINSAIDTTPNRTKNTLSAYPREKTVVILGGYDKNLSYGILSSVLDKVKAVILCGENREKISAVCKSRAINVNTIGEAVSVAQKIASAGDYVILSPSSASFDMFKNYKEKGKAFEFAVRNLM